MDEDEIISQILNEETENNIDYNQNEYNIKSVLDSLGVSKDIVGEIGSSVLDSNDNLLDNKEHSDEQKEKPNEVEKGKEKEAEKQNDDSGKEKEKDKEKNKENEIIKKEKDEQIKNDLEKIKPKEKDEKENINEESQQKDINDFYPSFKNSLDFVQYLEVYKTGGQISNEMKSFILQNNRAEDNKYNVLEKNLLNKISNIMTDNNIIGIFAKINIFFFIFFFWFYFF